MISQPRERASIISKAARTYWNAPVPTISHVVYSLASYSEQGAYGKQLIDLTEPVLLLDLSINEATRWPGEGWHNAGDICERYPANVTCTIDEYCGFG